MDPILFEDPYGFYTPYGVYTPYGIFYTLRSHYIPLLSL